MQPFALPLIALAAACMPSAAWATEYVFDGTGDEATIAVGGDQPGTSSTLYLILTETSGSTYTFAYTLTNTSDITTNPDGRVAGFGFVTAPEASGGSVNGGYTNLVFNPASGQLGSEISADGLCVSNANGNGCSGSGGATVGSPATGTLTLTFSPSTQSLTLSDFGVRYQSLGLDGQGSGRGFQTPVPEPGTWGMMLLGFAGLGLVLRHRRKYKGERLLQVA